MELSHEHKAMSYSLEAAVGVASLLVIELVVVFLNIFDNEIKAISVICIICLLFILFLTYLYLIKKQNSKKNKIFFSTSAVLIIILSTWSVNAIATPYDTLKGRAISKNKSSHCANLEVNIISQNFDSAGIGDFTDSSGKFHEKNAFKGRSWVLFLLFDPAKSLMGFSETIMESEKLNPDHNSCDFPIHSAQRLDAWPSILFKNKSDRLNRSGKNSILRLANQMQNDPDYANKRLLTQLSEK
jgi:hypothetical protein